MKLKALVLSALLVSTAPALAQTPSDDALNRLYKLMHIEKQFNEMKNTMPTTVFEIIKKSIPEEKLNQLNDEQHQRWHDLQMDISQTTFAETFDTHLMNQIKNSWLQQAKKRFTQAEVQAATEFYRSPQGQGFLQKSTAMTPEFLQDLMPLILQSQHNIMQKHGQRWQNELRAIFPQESQMKAPE